MKWDNIDIKLLYLVLSVAGTKGWGTGEACSGGDATAEHWRRVRVYSANGRGRHDWDWSRVKDGGIFWNQRMRLVKACQDPAALNEGTR